ncbi:MAG: peptide chain release factor 2 [Deltaproteobacteria bacterium]|nr:peptide chain release factor 2 [Deltaproteobacteria bacterium]
MNSKVGFKPSLQRPPSFGGIFDVPKKEKRLQEVSLQSENPAVWNDPDKMQKLNKERSVLEKDIAAWKSLSSRSEDAMVLLEMSVEAGDEGSFQEVVTEAAALESLVHQLEIKKMLSGELDQNSTYISINSGAGGTEAQDWAEMLYRMYMRYGEKQGYKVQEIERSDGEAAGIKSATLLIEGPYAYGYLKAENGVHRLVRVSPYDSNARRHTSFASVFCWAEVDDDIKVDLNMADVKVDTYRASGAGGQHVNKTDSAVRMTHLPTGIVVQCQNERSQHSNRDRAIKMLKAAMYEREVEARNKAKDEMNSVKKAVEWGSQIRSYVMHPYQLVKDHRTQFETSQVQTVMDGSIDDFIYAYLKNPVNERASSSSLPGDE